MPVIADFDVSALYNALDAQRAARGLSWRGVADQITAQSAGWFARRRATAHPVSPSTLSHLGTRRGVSANHALGVLRWLDRAPESFIPDFAERAGAALPQAGPDRILRWDAAALHAALDAQRRARGMSWTAVAREARCSPAQVTGLARLRYAPGMVSAMRMVQWLDRPAADFVIATP
jgi:hypothetical protein